MTEKNTDNRTTAQLFKEWRKINEVKRNLIRGGKINGDATPDDIVKALRELIPPSVFNDQAK